MQETIKTHYPDYYKNKRILFAMQKYTYKREFSLIAPKHAEHKHTTRFLKAHNTQSIKYLLDQFKVMEGKKYNLYTSLAKYKRGIPNQTMNFKKRDNTQWKREHWKHIEQYDLFLDVDSEGNLQEAKKQANDLALFFNQTKTPFYLRFSGNGFHFIVPETEFPKVLSYDAYGKKTIYHKYLEICNFLKDNVAPLLDNSIYDSQRQIKLPYSIAHYPNKEYVCVPLNNEFVEDFDEEMATPLKVFESMPREVLFNPNGSVEGMLKIARVKWD